MIFLECIGSRAPLSAKNIRCRGEHRPYRKGNTQVYLCVAFIFVTCFFLCYSETMINAANRHSFLHPISTVETGIMQILYD